MRIKHDAFLSYNRSDETYVQKIYNFLIEEGLTIWFDKENIVFGDRWIQKIQEGINQSKSCIVFIKDPISRYQQEEVEMALQREIEEEEFRVIPVLLQGMKTDTKIPPLLAVRQWVDLRSDPLNPQELRKLVRGIRGQTIIPIHGGTVSTIPKYGLPLGYSADVGKIISLLIGESLYSRKDVGIREIIQNSVDACIRRQEVSFDAEMNIKIYIDTKQGYFQVDDNGEGMNADLLANSFAVIGRSRRIYISTKYEGFDQINIRIDGISKQFKYHNKSRIHSDKNKIGTTVRVYLRKEFIEGDDKINIVEVVKQFCRHVRYLSVELDGQQIKLKKDWNTEGSKVIHVEKEPGVFELHLGILGENKSTGFIASNVGFLITDQPKEIMPKLMPEKVYGEINFFPGAVDLTLARDKIVDNNKSRKIRNTISLAIKKLLIKAVKNGHHDRSLINMLMFFLVESEQIKLICIFDQGEIMPVFNESNSIEDQPLDLEEASELLIDAWIVEYNGKKTSLRNAINESKKNNRNRIYYYDHNIKDIENYFKESLLRKGFLVIYSSTEYVYYTGNNSCSVNEESVLRILAEKYGFKLLSVSSPNPEDVDELQVNREELSPTILEIIEILENLFNEKIFIGRLYDAPPVFELSGRHYLNLQNKKFKELNNSSYKYNKIMLVAYIAGLLKYDLSKLIKEGSSTSYI